MKIKILTKIIPLLIICFSLSACNQEKANKESNNKPKEQSEVVDNKTTFDPQYYTLNDNYGIALSTLENNDKPRPEEYEGWIRSLTINYPQIYNMDDVDKENWLNDLLFKEALYIWDIINERNYIEYSIDYEIMEANEDVISILFTGFIQDPRVPVNIVDTVTIDLKNERIMDLSDFYKVDKSVLEKFKNKEFKPTDDTIYGTYDLNELVAEYISSYSNEQHLHDFYIKDGTIGLVIPAPQAMDYFIIEGLLDKK